MNTSNFIKYSSFKWHLEHAREVRPILCKNYVHIVWFRRKGQYFGRSYYRSLCLPVYSQECNEVLIAEGPEERSEKEGGGGTGKWNNATHAQLIIGLLPKASPGTKAPVISYISSLQISLWFTINMNASNLIPTYMFESVYHHLDICEVVYRSSAARYYNITKGVW